MYDAPDSAAIFRTGASADDTLTDYARSIFVIPDT
jgi:hypothetical protein